MSKILWKTPVPSTAFFNNATISIPIAGKCLIEYSYESEVDYSIVCEKIYFSGVKSFKCTYYMACSLEMLDAYDKILEIDKSSWLSEIKQNLLEADIDSKDLKHLRIYFDDGPCFEFICKSFEVICEEKKDYLENPINPV